MKVGLKRDFSGAGSLGPGSLDVLQLEAPPRQGPYRNRIEPIGSCPEVAPRDPSTGRHGNRAALSPRDGLQGMAERRPAAALYLHKRDESILFHHEVDLLTEETNVTVQDPPTPLLEEAFGQRFEAASATYGVQE